jgi:hypothetical protein
MSPEMLCKPSTLRALLVSPAVAAILVACVPANGSAASPAPAATTLSPELLVLEHQMEQLQISSERFSTTTVGIVTVESKDRVGRMHEHSERRAISVHEGGEVSLSSNRAKLTHDGRPFEIAIGSTLYPYSTKLAHEDGGRPWTRLDTRGLITAAGILPFHGLSAIEKAFAKIDVGSGPYAALINLIATATGEVSVTGPVTVDGQRTTEIAATVDPLEEFAGGEASEDGGVVPTETLEAFLSEAAVPLRVVLHTHTSSEEVSTTTAVLATNVAVDVRPPPARLTIGERQFDELELHRLRRSK